MINSIFMRNVMSVLAVASLAIAGTAGAECSFVNRNGDNLGHYEVTIDDGESCEKVEGDECLTLRGFKASCPVTPKVGLFNMYYGCFCGMVADDSPIANDLIVATGEDVAPKVTHKISAIEEAEDLFAQGFDPDSSSCGSAAK